MDYKDKNLQDDEEYLDIVDKYLDEVDEYLEDNDEYLDITDNVLEDTDNHLDTTDLKINNLDENDDVFSNNINEINGDNLEGMSLDSSDGDFQNSEKNYKDIDNSYSEPPSGQNISGDEKNNQNLEEKTNNTSDNDVQNGQKNTKDENVTDGKLGSSNPDSQDNEKNSENAQDTTKKPEESANSSENQFRRRGKDLSLQDKNFKNNEKNGYNPFDNLKKNNHNRINDNGNRRNNQEDNSGNNKDSKKTNKAQNAKQKALEESIRKYAQAHGIPKPIADKAAKLGAKKILVQYEKKKKQIQISLIAVVCVLLVILVPILGVSDMEGAEIVQSDERSSYLYQNGSDEDLYDYLIESNYCEDRGSCPTSEAANYYSVLRSELNANANLTKTEADVFITEMISYKRDNYFSHTDEIGAIADIIGSSGKFSLKNSDNYKEEFIGENGYFMTYRKDDLLVSDDSKKTMEKIYGNVVTTSRSISGKFGTSNKQTIITYSACPGVTVTGENAGTYDLEDYVAKVVSHENDWHPNGNLENNKVQAVAARTYVLYVTKNCTKSIESSANRQAISSKATQSAIDATKATEGEVLVDSNGKYVLTMYDAFCYTDVDSENYTLCQQGVKVPVTWVDKHISEKSLEYYESHSHGKGMSQWGSRYLSTQGYSYDKILATFYVDSKIQKLVSPSSGLAVTNSGFLKRISRALRDNAHFYNDGAQNEGECAWYAVRRTNEILANGGINIKVTSGGNGGDFCYSSQYKNFSKVYDTQNLKPGMVISWSSNAAVAGHSYGHVAIIEDVHYDSKGNVTSVDISEGSNKSGTGYNSLYNNHHLNNDYIWSLGNGDYKKQIRQLVCEGSLNGSTGSGCQKFTNVPASKIKNRWNGYKFECAIDLLG